MQSSHNLITGIPRIVAVHILSVWVDLRSLVHVDSAMCHSELRQYLQQKLQSPAFVVTCRRLNRSGDECMYWLWKKSIRAARLGNLLHTFEIISTYTQKFGRHILEAGIVDGRKEQFLKALTLHCPNLQVLRMIYPNVGEPLNQLFATCKKLHTLQVSKSGKSSLALKHSITAASCVNLHTIFWCVGGSSAEMVASIVGASANLRHLILLNWNCLDIVREISLIFGENTRNLERLAIAWTDASKKSTNKANATAFSAIAARCPSLKEFDISEMEVGEFHMNDVLRVVKRNWADTITSLKISFIVPRSHCCFNEMMGRCTQITTLRIGFSGPVQNFAMTCVVGHNFEEIDFSRWHRLTVIEIRGTPNPKYFSSISRNSERLQQLTLLQYGGALSDLDQILKVCSDFRLLRLLLPVTLYDDVLLYYQKWRPLCPKVSFLV